ncbi:MFS transporter [Streptomyces sp. NPDC001978]|uniref:MFS transporter n=1 Tax=Streptomyces sp. NPDC001978 TaxID=3364627 RepID=UPI00369720A9
MSALTSSRPSPAPRPSYAAVLRVPHARRTFAAALTARLSYGTVSLSVMLSATRATGSYTVAGVVMAVFGACTVFLMPVRAALVDRYGPRRALLPMAVLYSALLAGFAALTWRPGAPVAALVPAAALMGACAPPLGPTMRAVWSRLVDDRRLLQRAYSLDGVAEELLFVSGPVMVGVLLRFGPAPGGLLLSAVLMVTGTCAFVTSPVLGGGMRRSEPRRLRWAARGLPVGLWQPVVAVAGLGLALSGSELFVLAFVGQRSYDDAVVPWILGALSAGSAVGGLVNGAIDWRRSARVRLSWFTAGLCVPLALAGTAPGPWTLAGVMACAGAFVAPALTTAYLLAEETATEESRTRAGAWVNAAVNAGSSGGAVVAGLLVGRLPIAVCFMLAGVVALVTGAAAGRVTAGGA